MAAAKAEARPRHAALRSGLALSWWRIVSFVSGIGGSIVIARVLGPDGRGRYALPVALLAIAGSIGHAGVEQELVRRRGEGRGFPELWGASSLAAVGLGLLSAAVLAVASLTQAVDGLDPIVLLFAAVLLPVQMQAMYRVALLQLAGHAPKAARAMVFAAVAHTAAIVVTALFGKLTPNLVIGLLVGSQTLTWAMLAVLGRRHGLVGPWPRPAVAASLVRFALRFHLASMCSYLLFRIDQIIVREALGFAPLGLFSLAVSSAELLWLVTEPFSTVALPGILEARRGADRNRSLSAMRTNLTIGLVVGSALMLVGPTCLRLLYGREFAGASSAYRILLPGVVALAAQRPLGGLIVKRGRWWFISLVSLVSLVGNLGLNAVLIPAFGLAGAAWASTLAYLAMFGMYLVAVLRDRGDAEVPSRSCRVPEPPGPLRVLLVIGTLERGGTEHQVVALARGLAARGHRVTIACLSRTGPLESGLAEAGVRVAVGPFACPRRFFGAMPVGRTARWMASVVRSERPDVLHAFLYWSYMFAIPTGAIWGVPALVSARRNLSRSRGDMRFLRPVERLVQRLSHAITCNATAVRDDAVSETKVDPAKTRVIRNGVATGVHPAPVPGPPPVVICVANLIAYKGHRVLLEAFATALAAVPDLRLHLAGHGPEEDALKRQASELGITGAVEFLGSVGDVGERLRRASFCVLPSLTEGMPNAVLEAMSAGRAVIASDVGGVAEALAGGGGIVVAPGEAAALSEAIIRLASDPELAATMGRLAREDVLRRFGMERMVDEHEQLYAELLRDVT